MPPKSPSEILDTSSALKRLNDEAQNLLSIQSLVRKHTNAEIHVASLRKGVLHLVTASSAAATRLRYRQRGIISALRTQYRLDIATIKVSVRPEQTPKPPPVRQPLTPSNDSARQIADTAKYIEDTELRKALIRLAERGKG